MAFRVYHLGAATPVWRSGLKCGSNHGHRWTVDSNDRRRVYFGYNLMHIIIWLVVVCGGFIRCFSTPAPPIPDSDLQHLIFTAELP